MSRSVSYYLSAASVIAIGMTAPAFAQNVDQSDRIEQARDADAPMGATDPANLERGGIQTIVVTARKREESVQDVPVAVTAYSEELIQNRDITSVEKIAAIAPNFNVGRASNGSGAQLTLRGIGSSSTSIGIEQSVAVVVDGAYYGQGRVINEGFFDLARVEVLKGPQALFFGKNATAGVISLTTAGPGDEPEFIVRAGYEFNAQQYKLEGIASTPISDTVGIRLAARGSLMDEGYYENINTPITYMPVDANGVGPQRTLTAQPAQRDQPQEKEFLARGTIEWEAAPNFTATLKANYGYNKVKNNSWNYVAYRCGLPSGNSQLTPYDCEEDFVTHQNKFPTEIADDAPYAGDDGDLYNRYKSAGATLNLVYSADQFEITSVTNYQWNNNQWACACDFQSASGGPTWASENTSYDAWSQEMRFLSQLDGPLNFMVGGLYQKTKRDFEQYGFYGGAYNDAAPEGLVYAASSKISDTDGETFAVFGQLTLNVTDTLELAGGARYTDEVKESSFSQPYVNPALTAIFRPASAPLGVVTAKQHFKNVSPEATITWKPQQDLLVYGAFKTAYKSGGFSNGGINSGLSTDPFGDLTFDEETAEGFEAGIKSTILDNQLRLNLTAFTYDYNDLQVDFFNSPIFAFQTLTADARTRGIEFEFEYAPYSIPGLNFSGSVNYTDAEYTDFPAGPCYAGQTPAQGCNLAGNTRQDLTGETLSVAPDWTGTLGVGYETDIGSDYQLGLNVDGRYSDSYLPSGFGNELSRQDSYITLDAGVRFGAADRNWQVAVIGKNLTNEFFVTGVVDGPSTGSGTGTPAGVPADQLGFGNLPRTVQVELTKRF